MIKEKFIHKGLRVKNLNNDWGVLASGIVRRAYVTVRRQSGYHHIDLKTFQKEWSMRNSKGGPRDWLWGKLDRLPTIPSIPAVPSVTSIPIVKLEKSDRDCLRLMSDFGYHMTCEKGSKITTSERTKGRNIKVWKAGPPRTWKMKQAFWMAQRGKASTLIIEEDIYVIMSARNNYKGRWPNRTYHNTILRIFKIDPNDESREWIMRNVNVAREVLQGDEEAIEARKADVKAVEATFQFYNQMRWERSEKNRAAYKKMIEETKEQREKEAEQAAFNLLKQSLDKIKR